MSASQKTSLWALIVSIIVTLGGVFFSTGQATERLSTHQERLRAIEQRNEETSKVVQEIRSDVRLLTNDVQRILRVLEN